MKNRRVVEIDLSKCCNINNFLVEASEEPELFEKIEGEGNMLKGYKTYIEKLIKKAIKYLKYELKNNPYYLVMVDKEELKRDLKYLQNILK